MMDIKYRIKLIAASMMMLCMFMSTSTVADDIEIYQSLGPSAQNNNPNILFIVDTSGSMSALHEVKDFYNAGNTYTGACVPTSIYFSDDGAAPDCATTDNYFDDTANTCDHSVVGYNFDGTAISPPQDGSLLMVGTYSDQLAQFDPTTQRWRGLEINNAAERAYLVECRLDSGIDGNATNNVDYIEDGGTGWTGTEPADLENPHPIWYNNANNLQLYSGNYMNYLAAPTTANVGDTPVGDEVELVEEERIEIVKSAVDTMVRGNTQVDIGLMRFDSASKYEGGSITYPILDVGADRNDFFSRLDGLDADGYTTLSETYYEALLYFGGKTADYGSSANPSNQTGTTTGGTSPDATYNTPISNMCDNNYIVLLSDGAPTDDYLNATRRGNLTGFTTTSCNNEDDDDPVNNWNDNKDATISLTSEVDNCLDELSAWAFTHDVAELNIDAHEGEQKIVTHTIGFALADTDAIQLLTDTAVRGGGQFFQASNEAELIAIFDVIISGVLKENATFSSPAVSVNAFNRATNLDDLYFTLFKPTEIDHWEGNLKKFKLEFDTNNLPFIADANSNAAIDSNTGFFKDSSLSYWTVAADTTSGLSDGSETAEGGAASLLALPRNVYTFNGAYTNTLGVLTPSVAGDGALTLSTNDPRSGFVTYASLGITDAEATAASPYYFDDVEYSTNYYTSLIYWADGYDMKSTEHYDQPRLDMGDPLHAEPALVQYGLTAADEPDLVAYVATNDGYLHAFNTLTGLEYFAFLPQEMLPKLDVLYQERLIEGKSYGLDGNVVSWINDANGDGDLLDTGEHVYLYFGMRRGGRYIYSMDVTDRTEPKLRWVIDGGTDDYAELGQTWSAPNVEKIKIGVDGSGDDVYKVVLIFGAGYDTGQDLLTTRGVDSVGRGVMIVDAETGELLWRAGPDGTADLQLSDMNYSIPARIKPLDINGDGYVDTLFAGDMGGQIWRFDIDNSANTASTVSVTGGRVANFAVDGSVNDNRRFYNSPDVALIVEEGHAPYLGIVAASGYRAHPLQTDTHDRVYMMRDYNIYSAPASYTTITDADLYNATANDIVEAADTSAELALLGAAQGWYVSFEEMDGSFVGEKALSEPLILNGIAVFTTYIPASAGLNSDTCVANDGSGAIYFVNVVDATPTTDNTGDGTTTRADRRTLLTRGGIPPTPRVIITEDGIPTLCVGTECEKADDVGSVQKMYWYEVEG